MTNTLWTFKHALKQRGRSLSARWARWRYPKVFESILPDTEASEWIESALRSRRPFLLGRLGSVEARLLGESKWCSGHFSRITTKQAHHNAGIFPLDAPNLDRTAERLYDSLEQVDLLAVWDSPYQARLIAEGVSVAKRCTLSALEPWWHPRPWSAALAGSKVLVVHPFATSIEHQYLHRLKLFSDPRVLPEFELITLIPPQTLGGLTEGYSSWIVALDSLVDRVASLCFDVALVGCGAYGLPLAAAIKRMSRPALHLGGALQLLFGITGRRWEVIPSYAALSNEAWVRPLPEETPAASALVDGGCYW